MALVSGGNVCIKLTNLTFLDEVYLVLYHRGLQHPILLIQSEV